MYRFIAFSLFVFCIGVAAGSSVVHAQDRAIVFGDSLSDNGNLFVSDQTFTPSPPYFSGGASNGPLWAEQLFGPMNSPVQGTGVVGNVNMAYFGARTDSATGSGAHVPGAIGVPDQITDFTTAGGVINATDTVFVWAAANNIRECILDGSCPTPAAIRTNATAAANAQIANIQTLVGLGARTLIVPNAQNIGATPIFDVFAPPAPLTPASANEAALTSKNVFNAALLPGLRQLAASAPPGTNIIYADVDAVQNVILANPAAFGFTNVTDRCFDGVTTCGNPNSYYFWDFIHPTAAVQGLFALYFSLLLDTTPAMLDTAPLGDSLHSSGALVTDAVFDRLANWFSGVYVQKNGPYAEVIGQLGRHSEDDNRPDFDLDLGGIRVGWDQRFDAALLGASVALLSGSLDSQNLSSDITNVRGDIYGTYTAGPLYASLNLGYGGSRIDDIKRNTGFGPVVANSETEGYIATAAAEVGVAQGLGGIIFIPSARLTYIHAELDGYEEQADLLALVFEDRTSDALLGRVNLRAVSNVDFAGMPTAIFAEVGYEWYLSFSGGDITAVLANNTALPAVASPGDPNGPGFLGKLGLSSQVSQELYVDLNYGISLHDDGGQTHSGSARLKAHF